MGRNIIYENYGLDFLNKLDESNYNEMNKKRSGTKIGETIGKMLKLLKKN